MTEYVILKQESASTPDVWIHLPGFASASSAKRALALAKVGPGKHVAIPARSWVPLTVKVEQTTKITIG